jgi:hypothetical protein
MSTDNTPLVAMKNADDMLKAIMEAVDTSGDGKIQYEGTFKSSREAFTTLRDRYLLTVSPEVSRVSSVR